MGFQAGAMTLLKVEYEFFAYEEPSSDAHELHRQIRLLFADSPALYLSWTWERQRGSGSEPYSIACSESSYFTDDAARVVDASGSALWSKQVGCEVELAYTPSLSGHSEYQVLEVRSGTDCTYVYSLGLDCIGISRTSPLEGRFTAG
jgi:hypothetical protein